MTGIWDLPHTILVTGDREYARHDKLSEEVANENMGKIEEFVRRLNPDKDVVINGWARRFPASKSGSRLIQSRFGKKVSPSEAL